MNRRTKAINKSMKDKRKMIREFDVCQTCKGCFAKYDLHISHLLKRDSRYIKYDRNEDVFLQCSTCHRQYEELNPIQRLQYLKERSLYFYEKLKAIIDSGK